MTYLSIFNERWATLFVLLGLMGILARAPALSALSLIGLTLVIAGFVLRRWSLKGVRYERRFDQNRVFVGETFTLSRMLSNDSRMPILSLLVRDDAPRSLRRADDSRTHYDKDERVSLTQMSSLKPHEVTRRDLQLRATRRGHYLFEGASLRAFDLLGTVISEQPHDRRDALLVYPRIFPIEALDLPTQQPMGALPTLRRLIEDPERHMGTRDYVLGDSFRQIHWKASAHRGQLQTRIHEHSAEPTVMILFNVTTLEHEWYGSDVEVFEWSVSVAGSLAQWAHEGGCALGMSLNGSAPNMMHTLRIRPRRAPDQFTRLMESLAVIGSYTRLQFDVFLLSEQRHIPFGATLVVITAMINEPMLIALRQLHDAGKRIVVVYTARKVTPLLGGQPYHWVHVPPLPQPEFIQLEPDEETGRGFAG